MSSISAYENGITPIDKITAVDTMQETEKLCPLLKKKSYLQEFSQGGSRMTYEDDSFQPCLKDECMMYKNGECRLCQQ